MQKLKFLFGLMLLCCWSSASAANSVINEVRYEGNLTTENSLLNREIFVKPGDVVDYKTLEKSRQALMDLGLFKRVSFRLEEGELSKDNSQNKQVDVVFVVDEKYYLLVLPRAKIDDDEMHLGVQLRWDNVWGLNHEMRALFENRGDTLGVEENRKLFSYFYPNVNNSAYNLGINIQDVNEIDETDGAINRHDDKYRVSLSRWLNKQGRNRGWFVGGSLLYQQRDNEVLVGSELSDSLNAVVLGLDVGFISVSNYEYNRGGKAYGYKLDWSHESIGSDDYFTKHLFYYRSYYRFHDHPLSNLNVQTIFGHSNNDILGKSAFTLGSRNDLRGYENSRFNGDTMLLTNIEYMFPHENRPIIRYVSFIDIGSTYDQLSDVFHQPLNLGVGFGIRWKIRSFVKLDLRADFGYGISDSDYKASFGTRHAF